MSRRRGDAARQLIMLEAVPEKQTDAALKAARATAWRRFIDAIWAGDGCAHAELDLLRRCRTCGEHVPDGERV